MEHELLLQAALLSGAAASSAFRAWRERAALVNLDPASEHLLPLLARNLERQGVVTPLDAWLREHYLLASYHSHRLARTVAPAVAAMVQAGIRVMILKGAALARSAYGDEALRWMTDIDVLVDWKSMPRVLPLLEQAGFEGAVSRHDELRRRHRRHEHAIVLKHRDGPVIDLHWRVLVDGPSGALDEELWASSVPLYLEAIPVRTLPAHYHLVHALIHGLAGGPTAAMRWIPDAMVLLSAPIDRAGWNEVVRFAQQHRYIPHILAGLDHLASRYGAPVPPDVLQELGGAPVSRAEQLEFWVRTNRREAHLLDKLVVRWVEHRRSRAPGDGRGIIQETLDFVSFLYRRLGSPRGLDLARVALDRLAFELRAGRGTPGRTAHTPE